MRALIAGATGFVGRRLAPALRSDGLEVRCLVRDRSSAPAQLLASEGFELVEFDLAGEGDLGPAMDDVDVAYFLVHLMGRVADYSPLERRAAARFATPRGPTASRSSPISAASVTTTARSISAAGAMWRWRCARAGLR